MSASIPTPPVPTGTPRQPIWSDLAVSAGMLAAGGAAWAISRMGIFRSGDDLSYRLAVAGGVMMLLVFLYPLRKHVRGLHRLGQARVWLWVHIGLGLLGPWLILLHSTFHIGSVNAGVALASMVVVVLSGVVGRFLYVRVHRGLQGERTTLRELQQRAGFVEAQARSRLHFVPQAEALLVAFEQQTLRPDARWRATLQQVFWLPVRQTLVQWRCHRALRSALQQGAAAEAWDTAEFARRERHGRDLVRQYLLAVVRVAQFTAYDRVFGLWHVAHLPFVVLLVVSAVVHVVAVHAY